MKFVLRLIMMVAITIGLIIGSTSFAHADEPVVDLGGIQYAEAKFETDGSAAAKASLTAQSGAKVVLNVHVNPMPKRQIKRCWKVKPGTWIKNEVIDPATGRPAVINWKVPAGDNTFCTKKGAGKQVFKKSCGNRVWGVPGGPKSPPKSLPRIKVKVQIQDYLTFKGKLKVQTSQSGSASAYVVQYYEGKKVCEASASVRGTGYVSVEAYISVRARTFTAIRVSATNSAQVSANTQITASGSLKAAVKLVLEGEARAMCNFTPPPPPPPPHDECPNIPGDQPPGYECNPPPVIVDLKRINDLNPGWETPVCAKADFQMDHNGKLTFSFESGGITGTNPVMVADMQEGCATLVAPTDPGTYTYKVTATDSVTGASVTKESQPFQVWASPPPPA